MDDVVVVPHLSYPVEDAASQGPAEAPSYTKLLTRPRVATDSGYVAAADSLAILDNLQKILVQSRMAAIAACALTSLLTTT
eukprot:1708359-Amphidinium_carterae.1